MRPHGAQTDLFGSPILIGTVAVVMALVGMLLAYNANDGLPFVPTYKVKAVVPDAAELTEGNEVRVGGKRVGVITTIEADVSRAGVPRAVLHLKLDRIVEPLSRDSKVTVRPRSTLGLKYLELQPGRGRATLAPGETLPVSRAQPIVELDEVVNAFDAQTRAGLQGVLDELGTGVAGRGRDVNRAIEAFNPLLVTLTPVAANLRAGRTDLAGLIAGLAATTGAVAPVAAQLGSLFDGAAATLAAVEAAGTVGEILAEAPATEAVATRAARNVRPVLTDAAAIVRSLRPAVRVLPRASLRLALAVETGTPVLRRATALADRLEETLGALEALMRNPATGGSVRKLLAVVTSLEPTLRFVNPVQVQCNYLGLWTRNANSAISEGDANGTWFRFIPVVQADELIQSREPAPALHANVYPHGGEDGECEAGREPWLPGRRIGNVPGNQGAFTEATAPPAGTPQP